MHLSAIRLVWVSEFGSEFAQGYCERASDEFWPPAPDQSQKSRMVALAQTRSTKQQARSKKDQIKIVARDDLII
jgi:hypothetical protein